MSRDKDSDPRKSLRWTPEQYRQRPVHFDPAKAEVVIERVREGETLDEVCRDNRDMPTPGRFLTWMEQDETLRAQYEAARRIGRMVLVDRMPMLGDMIDSKAAHVHMKTIQWLAERELSDTYAPGARGRGPELPNHDMGGEVRQRIERLVRRREQDHKEKAG